MPAGEPPPSAARTLHFPVVTSTKLTVTTLRAQQKPCKLSGKGKPKLKVPNRKKHSEEPEAQGCGFHLYPTISHGAVTHKTGT